MKIKKVLFIYTDTGAESLAIQYISSALKRAGHQTDLIIEYSKEKNFYARLHRKIVNYNPDFIAFSVVTDNYKWASKHSKYIKENFPQIKILWGGLQVTSCPEEVIKNNFIDYAVIGEGDETIVELTKNPEKENILGCWINKNGKIIKNENRKLLTKLDNLPFPDKELFYREAPYLQDKYYCIVGKGCPFSCTYCFNSYMKKLYQGEKWVRKRSVDNVIEELKIAKQKFKPKTIYFADDCLTNNKEWLREFIFLYKKFVNIPFTGQSHPHFLDKETCKMLKGGGCLKMQVGSQSSNEEKRRTICNRNETNESILNAVDNLKKNKILVQVDHIFDLPTETVEEYQKGLNFYIDLKPNQFEGFILQYYPNTKILDIGKEHGIITDEIEQQIIKGNKYPDINLKNQTINDINGFIQWIPIFPRWLSRLVVKKRAYRLFRNDKLFKLSLYIRYFTTPILLKGFFNSFKKRKIKQKLLNRINKKSSR